LVFGGSPSADMFHGFPEFREFQTLLSLRIAADLAHFIEMNYFDAFAFVEEPIAKRDLFDDAG
jgi:hypothetical protein